MNSTRVPTIAIGAGGVAARPASGSDLQTFALSRMPSGIADPAFIENKADDRAFARGESVSVVRCDVPVSMTMQTRSEGRPI
ncbi:MAG: hypothetical protein NVS4B4_02450 [Bradyrhizobium sp.]